MIPSKQNNSSFIEVYSKDLTLSFAGKILIDFGFNVTKVGKNIPATIFDQNKKLIPQHIQSQTITPLINSSSCILLHEDHPNIQTLIKYIQTQNNKIIILVVHRINQKFKQKFNDAQILALSGLLSHFGQTDNVRPEDNLPQPPPLLSSIASSVSIVIRLLQALQNKQSGIIRFSMLHHVMYLGLFHLNSLLLGLTFGKRGTSMLEGGAPFYRIYETKNSYICIGNIETKFYEQMLEGLKLDVETSLFLLENQMNVSEWGKMIKVFEKIFSEKTTEEWLEIMDKYDTCITGIYELTPPEYIENSPILSGHKSKNVKYQPKLVPKL